MKQARIFTAALIACSAAALGASGAEDERHPLNVPATNAPVRPAAAASGPGLGTGTWAARVQSDGTLASGVGATAATRLGAGTYEVDFNRDVSGCFYTASTYTLTVATYLQPRAANPNGVFLIIQSLGSTTDNPAYTNSQFYLQVYCGS